MKFIGLAGWIVVIYLAVVSRVILDWQSIAGYVLFSFSAICLVIKKDFPHRNKGLMFSWIGPLLYYPAFILDSNFLKDEPIAKRLKAHYLANI